MSAAIMVVRLGGSHAFSPLLRPWLAAIRAAAGGVVVVPGGGPFADAVRLAQTAMGFDDLAAHRMALLGMAQYGLALAGLGGPFVAVDTMDGLDATMADQRIPVWSPWPMLRDAPDIAASWDVTSDSLALWLARAIGAFCVLVIKHVETLRGATARSLVAQGVLDAAFPDFYNRYQGTVYLAGPDDLPSALDVDRPPGRRLPRDAGD
jgi:5-(aminomethyl)-3-furanmethanol phosphate kinase